MKNENNRRRNLKAAHRRWWKRNLPGYGQEVRCALCGQMIRNFTDHGRRHFTVDHRVPLHHGGPDEPENWQPAHYDCNLKKARAEFRPVISQLEKYHGEATAQEQLKQERAPQEAAQTGASQDGIEIGD